MKINNIVRDNFKNPRNVGRIKDPDGFGEAKSSDFGDIIYFYLKIEDNKIKKITFETFGCYAAMASASVISELAEGLSLDNAMSISEIDTMKILGDLPPEKLKCVSLAIKSLKKAINSYQRDKRRN